MQSSNGSETLIVIPARYASKRLPGKPLLQIAGKSMLQRVHETAMKAAKDFRDVEVVVATDDKRISRHAREIGAVSVMTDESCRSGTDRAYQAAKQYTPNPRWVVNLQGDTPLTPASIIRAVIEQLHNAGGETSVVTPVRQLTWKQLDDLVIHKKTNPFSGTTVITDTNGVALWFSKSIIPAVRSRPESIRPNEPSPVFQHVGIYAYPIPILEQFVALPESRYEAIEGLEQLRLIENGITVQTICVDSPDDGMLSGVDTQADLERVSDWIRKYGDPTETKGSNTPDQVTQ
jgi:3-deoxy-manno-octulosonate cytidylyltransferase (CMP-KDO synthetase)